MGVALSFQPQLVEFEPRQLEDWRAGDRSDCRDPYCRGIAGGSGSTAGFGEYLVGRHWQELGFGWAHHDFDVFGLNPHKSYACQPVLERLLRHRLQPFRALCDALKPFHEERHEAFEQPDLFIYRESTGEVRFAECKRADTRDKVNQRQALGLFLLTAVLRVPVDIFVVSPVGKLVEPLAPINFSCDLGIAPKS